VEVICPSSRPGRSSNVGVLPLSMVLPFGPAVKQALLVAADSTARAKLLIAFLEMSAFGDPSDTPPGRTN
jgi:Lon protease-like protein